MGLDWLYIARDGAILALGACGLIAAVILWRPTLLRRHFPAELRARLTPPDRAERARSLAAGLLLIGWIFGVVIASTRAAETRLGAAFLPLFAHAWLVGMVFNLADWLILDELWLGRFPPLDRLPEAAGGVPFERAKHATDFLKGSVGFAIIAAAVAGVLVLA